MLSGTSLGNLPKPELKQKIIQNSFNKIANITPKNLPETAKGKIERKIIFIFMPTVLATKKTI